MAGWRPWRELRARGNIDFSLIELPGGARAICASCGPDRVILIDRSLPPAERLAALAHELVHLERGGGCHHAGLPGPLRVLVLREERRVDTIVAERLVPLAELAAFIDARSDVEPITAALVASEFEVPVEIGQRALDLLVERLGEVA